jgi:hypothetical protein
VGAKIKDAWLEYEEGRTVEARFVKEGDKLECLIQAHEYEQATFGEKDLEEFQGLSSKIQSPRGVAVVELLKQERKAHFAKRHVRTPVIFVIGKPSLIHPSRSSSPSLYIRNESIKADIVLNLSQAGLSSTKKHSAISSQRSLGSRA